MNDLLARARTMREQTLPSYRPKMDENDYILATCDADVAITAAELGNGKTVDRLLDRLTKMFEKIDEERQT